MKLLALPNVLLGGGTARLLVQIADSAHVSAELEKYNAIFAAPNNVQGVLLVKLFRFQCGSVAAPGGGAIRTVGPHQFDDPGFIHMVGQWGKLHFSILRVYLFYLNICLYFAIVLVIVSIVIFYYLIVLQELYLKN